ncbi:MAG: hypothetical protein LUG99_21360 [Lachnospiraceae bacterium]|nr:hypothetical protein [Lachnospiraceae bacterium]
MVILQITIAYYNYERAVDCVRLLLSFVKEVPMEDILIVIIETILKETLKGKDDSKK